MVAFISSNERKKKMSNLVAKFTKNLLKGIDANIVNELDSVAALYQADVNTPLVMLSGTKRYSVGFCFFTGKAELPAKSLKCSAALVFEQDENGVFDSHYEISFKGTEEPVLVCGEPQDMYDMLIKALSEAGASNDSLELNHEAREALTSKGSDLSKMSKSVLKSLNS